MPNNTFTPTELRELVWCDVRGKYGNQQNLANRIGVYTGFLNDVLHGKRKPGKKVLAFYHLEERTTYVRVGK